MHEDNLNYVIPPPSVIFVERYVSHHLVEDECIINYLIFPLIYAVSGMQIQYEKISVYVKNYKFVLLSNYCT